MKLAEKTHRWVAEKIITPEQASRILEFEGRPAERSWALYAVAGLGAIILITGVISIIAANWDAIPPVMKLGIYAAAQCALGWLVFTKFGTPGLGRETALTLFALLFLAGIGLVGQTFNLRSDGYSAILFWLVLALTSSAAAQSRLLPNLWVLGLGAYFTAWVTPHEERIWIAVAVGFFCASLAFARAAPIPASLRKALGWWSVLFALSTTPVANAMLAHGFEATPEDLAGTQWILAGAAGALVMVLSFGRGLPSGSRIPAALLVPATALYLMWALYAGEAVSGVTAAIGFIAIWCLAAACAGFMHRRRLFDMALLVVALRTIVIYFEVFGSLAATGIGLIVSGAVILGIAFGWNKLRIRGREWFKAA